VNPLTPKKKRQRAGKGGGGSGLEKGSFGWEVKEKEKGTPRLRSFRAVTRRLGSNQRIRER